MQPRNALSAFFRSRYVKYIRLRSQKSLSGQISKFHCDSAQICCFRCICGISILSCCSKSPDYHFLCAKLQHLFSGRFQLDRKTEFLSAFDLHGAVLSFHKFAK